VRPSNHHHIPISIKRSSNQFDLKQQAQVMMMLLMMMMMMMKRRKKVSCVECLGFADEMGYVERVQEKRRHVDAVPTWVAMRVCFQTWNEGQGWCVLHLEKRLFS
jgi:hypothetical protein